MKIKELILFSLTLGLTFPGAHLLAGGWMSRQEAIENAAIDNNAEETQALPTIPFDVITAEILTRTLNEAFEQCDWKTVQSIALVSKRHAQFVKKYTDKLSIEEKELLGLNVAEKELVKKYRNALKKILDSEEDSFNTKTNFDSLFSDFCTDVLIFNKGVKAAKVVANIFLEFAPKLDIECSISIEKKDDNITVKHGAYWHTASGAHYSGGSTRWTTSTDRREETKSNCTIQ